VTRSEFRLLLVYLAKYYELFEKFEDIDSSDDKRITKTEFKSAVGHLEKWGIKIDNPDTEFDSIDQNKGGYILFKEFADWGLKKHLDNEDDDE
jgi:Ca2+-binding EF-hand superfamily protein